MVTVVETDSNCNLTARATVEIVGPFSVAPERATVMRGGMATFTAQNVIGPLRYEIYARPTGAGAMGSITNAGVFTAGNVDGEYQIVATDDGAQKSARLVVEVGTGAALRPMVAVLAVPSGGRVRIDLESGSGSYRYAVANMARGRVVEEGGRAYFIAPSLQPSGDRAGSSVLLGALSAAGAVDSIVSAPFAHSPATMTARAAQTASVGAIEAYGSTARTPLARFAKTAANGAQQPMIALDFDGDGTQELAIAERGDTVDSRLADVPNECKVRGTSAAMGDAGATSNPISVGSRGIVHVYKLMGGQFVERWRVISRGKTVPLVSGAPQGLRLNGFGASISAADVDGDGKDDLIVGRPGGVDSNGADIVLGRANASSTIAYVCNAGKDAYNAPVGAPTDTTFYGISVDGVGDLNGDGCDEVAIGVIRNAAATNPSAAARAGFLLVFGANTDGARAMPRACAFRTAATMLVVPDDRNLADNVAGDAATRDNDVIDLTGLPGTMGRVFALGMGDLDGDGAADIAYRTADLAFGAFRGPAVEVLSGRHLSQCVTGACPAALAHAFVRDGNYRAIGVRTLGAPYRLVAPSLSPIVTRWGSSIAIAEVTGDAAAELFVGSPDDSAGGDFAGAVYGFRGGAAAFTQRAQTDDPWLLAVGDIRERGDFGVATAAMRSSGAGAFLLVGSPLASRAGAGGELGAGYRWSEEVP